MQICSIDDVSEAFNKAAEHPEVSLDCFHLEWTKAESNEQVHARGNLLAMLFLVSCEPRQSVCIRVALSTPGYIVHLSVRKGLVGDPDILHQSRFCPEGKYSASSFQASASMCSTSPISRMPYICKYLNDWSHSWMQRFLNMPFETAWNGKASIMNTRLPMAPAAPMDREHGAVTFF